MDTGKLPVLFLSGFMGTGKSTVGRRVAERAGVPFVDLDAAVVARAGRRVSEIFATEGEAGFRRREAEEFTRTMAEPGARVVALGGGALLDAGMRRAALCRACVVTLAARKETIVERTSGEGRPLLDAAADRGARIGALLEGRAPAYAEAHARVDTDALSVEAVADAVLEVWTRRAVAVALGLRSYPVRFADGEPQVAAGMVAGLRPSQVFLVTDANVARLWGGGVRRALDAVGVGPTETVVMPAGEQHKQLRTVEQALGVMVRAGADRDAVVVGLGGGVVTDMAGLAAALLLRGVRWVALPTTLLAMVDASVGGKTGVDLGPAKNALGAFHQPSGVVVDASCVSTESARGYTSGLSEVVKSALVGDAGLFEQMESSVEAVRAREPRMVEEMAVRAVAVKASIVSRDERESGDRALLNFGHTLGHALEAEGGFSRLTHGEAVSLGMVAALRVGEALGVTAPALAGRVTELLERLGLPTDLGAQPVGAALPFVGLDKKRRGGAVRFVLLRGVGEAVVERVAPEALGKLLEG